MHFFIEKISLLLNDTLYCKRSVLIYLHARELFMFLFSSVDFLHNKVFIVSYRDIHAYVYHKYSDTLNTFNMLCPLNKAKVIFKGSN